MNKINKLMFVLLLPTLVGCTFGGSSSSNTPSDSSEVPTALTLNKESLRMSIGEEFTLTHELLPTTCTSELTWSSSTPSVASVENGIIKALALGETTISAKTYNDITAECVVSVEEFASDYTVMIYMCGNDLESESYLATEDITEILKVDLPESVNVIIETGGARKWSSKYGISASYLTRWHVENKTLVKDTQLTKANMGLSSTFQSFLEWGLTEYPAKQTGLIMWNHGGAMDGVCYDENFGDDSLLNGEVHTAVGAAMENAGLNGKLDWIGYDACLMAVADIADFNSDYFDYMFSSQESEPGEGWEYTSWLNVIAQDPSVDPLTVGKAITDSYMASSAELSDYYNDTDYATFSILDLSKMKAFTNAWEAFANELDSVITSSTNWSTFRSLVRKCQTFGESQFDVFDVADFCSRMLASSTYTALKTYIQDIETALNNVVLYHKSAGSSAGACGLNFFCAVQGYSSKSTYSTSQTNYTNWREILISYGTWY